ncbi:MerR family transcriptional regulator [Kineosporia sp. R_H_3]|uniref:MerR family transcriptional regulator n=1 Tax=Kineosporia sp. R_H_3 TaxID=1961848 RepID=UPI000B4C065B|nr:MerR family transcriptional regulator [Kineosporia sp. R_H_3]
MSAGTAPEELTIDQLAAAVGLTVRTVRSYTTRGLLPPPRLRGRTGLYGREHLARLHVLREMLDAGYTLSAAEQVLAVAPTGVSGPGLDVYRALLNPWQEEDPELVEADVLAARMGVDLDAGRLAQLTDLGLVRVLPDGRLELPRPSLVRAGLQLSSLGIGMDDVLATQAVLDRHAKAMAQACVDLFRSTVWGPFEAAGQPEEGWPAVRDAFQRALPLASQSVLVTFRQALADQIARAVAEAAAGRAGAAEPNP